MGVLSYLYFSTFFVCAITGVALLISDVPVRAGRSLAGLAFALGFWALGYTGITSNLVAERSVLTWYRIAAIGWIGFVPMVFWFVYSLCYPKRHLPRWTFVFFALWATALLIKQWTGTIFVSGFRKLPVGWGRVGFLGSWWALLYLTVFFTVVIWSIFSLTGAIRRTPQRVLRRPLVVILLGLILNYAAGTVNVILLPALGASFPNILVFPVFFVILTVALMMLRHRFLLTDYRPIMEEIMDTLTDAIIIADANGQITRLNRTARECFNLPGDAESLTLEDIVDGNSLFQVINDVSTTGSLPRELPLVNHPGCDGPDVRATLHPVTDERRGLSSIVLVIPLDDRDIRFLKARGFTRQEITVAKLVLEGYTNAEIARQIFVSYGTVKNHVSRIFSKIGVNNRSSFIRHVRSGACD